MNDREWRTYLRLYQWMCPECQIEHPGLREVEAGRLIGRCPYHERNHLVFIWGGSGWIDAVSAGIVLEED